MKFFEKVMYPVLVILIFFYIYQARTNPGHFENVLAAEGGSLQWLIISTLLFASIMCFYRASILRPFRGGVFAACLILAGFVFMAFAMEETSWGQIIFNYQTPEFIRVRNAQGEMNIRHLVIGGFEIADIIFTLGIKILATTYFIVLPFFYSRLEKIKNFVNRFAIPLPRYTQTAAYAGAAILMSFIPSSLRHIVFEFVFYWILVLMMYNPLNDEVFSRKSLVR
ncbi:MAG: hypothetical protein K2Q18_15800 [Bdellovibrionales bacterium]|nr:hypothetical protein [Bdellovibrionales bacterium]